MASSERTTVRMGQAELDVVRGGSGAPLLVLHDELGYTGWLDWHEKLSQHRELIIPLQPGYGETPLIDWITSYRDVGTFYSRFLREQGLDRVDVIGFSAGGYIAAEMAAAAPTQFRSLTLVAPLGVRPSSGEIYDFLAVTVRSHVDLLVADKEGLEYKRLYGGSMTVDQFERLEDARAETARLGWEPFMFNPSLPHLLEGIGDLPTLIVWGEDDAICPRGSVDVYQRAITHAHTEILPGIGHCPELQDPDLLLATISPFLARPGVLARGQ